MKTKYSQIQDGAIFRTSNGSYRKLDALYFEDLRTQFEEMWSPMFDATITLDATSDPFAPVNDEFIATENPFPSTPVVSTSLAEKAFGEMWGSGNFDCGHEDYMYMAGLAVAAIRAIEELGAPLGLPATHNNFSTIVDHYAGLATPMLGVSKLKPIKKKDIKKAVKKVTKTAKADAKKLTKKKPVKSVPKKKSTKKGKK